MREKWMLLYERLKINTMSEHVKWRETSDENVFVSSVGDITIAISLVERGGIHNADVYTIEIFKDEKLVDKFTDEDLSGDPSDDTYFRDMSKFMDAIRRKLSGADDIIDRLIAKLADPDEIPF